ncbi:MAG: hypothetical protein E6K90_09710 [Thaumarchaeota archaeon]|nr:MAG: hypothetical protein E6K90_09710 [Nitrososphaerota archaeon]
MRVGSRLVEVDLRPIGSVLPHEETITDLSSRLSDQIRADGFQRDPIIVDRENHVVLDGMHRLRALRELGARHILCHLVDYSSPEIRLERWARSLKGVKRESLAEILKDSRIDRRVSRKEAIELVDGRSTPVAVLTSGSCFVASSSFRSLAESFELVRRLDEASRAMGLREDFIEEEIIETAIPNPGSVVILTPRVEKKEVIEAAKGGRLFPHKSTMHVIGIRAVGVNYPLSELQEEEPSQEVRASKLEGAKGSILDPPVTYFGRRYWEKLLVVRQE